MVLAVILVILMLLLRSILAPVLLIATVVLSYAAALGVSALVFNHVFGFPGADAAVPLFGFVFLVALGVDYNIFLMTRVREESLQHGTRPGILRGLGVTGGVITSAGVVLAATFAALGVIPHPVPGADRVHRGVRRAARHGAGALAARSRRWPTTSGRRIWWPGRLSRPDAQVTRKLEGAAEADGPLGPRRHSGRGPSVASGDCSQFRAPPLHGRLCGQVQGSRTKAKLLLTGP